MTPASITRPERLGDAHDLETFDCGDASLNDWLRHRARKSEANGGARTYVVTSGGAVIGYYCLAAGAITRAGAPKRLQRNMPDPIPVMVLGRLAIDIRFQSIGIGTALLKDAAA